MSLEPQWLQRLLISKFPLYSLLSLYSIVSNFTSLLASSIEYYAHKMFIISRRYVVGMLFKDIHPFEVTRNQRAVCEIFIFLSSSRTSMESALVGADDGKVKTS